MPNSTLLKNYSGAFLQSQWCKCFIWIRNIICTRTRGLDNTLLSVSYLIKIMIFIIAIYTAQLLYQHALMHCFFITPGYSQAATHVLKGIRTKNSYQVSIYYTWVEADNCGQQNALSMGILGRVGFKPKTL